MSNLFDVAVISEQASLQCWRRSRIGGHKAELRTTSKLRCEARCAHDRANSHQLGNAYQELGRELCTDTMKVVGGYTLGRVIGEGQSIRCIAQACTDCRHVRLGAYRNTSSDWDSLRDQEDSKVGDGAPHARATSPPAPTSPSHRSPPRDCRDGNARMARQ